MSHCNICRHQNPLHCPVGTEERTESGVFFVLWLEGEKCVFQRRTVPYVKKSHNKDNFTVILFIYRDWVCWKRGSWLSSSHSDQHKDRDGEGRRNRKWDRQTERAGTGQCSAGAGRKPLNRDARFPSSSKWRGLPPSEHAHSDTHRHRLNVSMAMVTPLHI